MSVGGHRDVDRSLPDSIFTWIFQARDGSSWGGRLVADSAWAVAGDTIAGLAGTYTILLEEERGTDLTPFDIEDGEVFVEWYRDAATGRFLPTLNGPSQPGGRQGLGSELDAAWSGLNWLSFGLGGTLLAAAERLPADTRFDFVFEADSGDRWSGVLYEAAGLYAPGDTLRTPYGTYRIVELGLPERANIASGEVRLMGSYFDSAGGAYFAVRDTEGAVHHGRAGLGSEAGTVWNGLQVVHFGRGGADQVDTPIEFRPLIRGFGVEAGGWTSQDRFPRMLADVTGDGRADVVGFGNAGALVAPANEAGGFDAAYFGALGFGFGAQAGGWSSQDRFPRMLGDVNGDRRADIVGFGNAGAWVALADGGGGFAAASLAASGFGFLPQAGGWTGQDLFPRMLGDVNGDRRADIVAFGADGAWVALADGSGGFGPAYLAANAFGFGTWAGGWTSQDRFPRMLADVDGDGLMDIVGFGNAGAWVSLADGGGGFGAAYLAAFGFGAQAGGWSGQDRFPRLMADVNGDRRADIVGFGNAGAWVSLADEAGFYGAARLLTPAFGVVSAGWSRQNEFPRAVADINGDGRADIVGFGSAGVWADTFIGYY